MTLQNLFGDLALDASVQEVVTQATATVTALGALDMNTDGLEASLDQLNTTLSAVDVDTDAIVAALNNILLELGNIDTNTVSLASLITATNAAIAALGPLTNTQLRATPVPVSITGGVTTGGLTDTQLRASAVPVSGPLTDAQLRAANVPVSGTFFPATQPVSAAALPLPAGAATAAKQPALGTAGTPAADVLSVQGEAGMTPIKTDGSATTQPVSIAAEVEVKNDAGNPLAVSGTFFPATQPVSAAALPLPAGASTAAKQPAIGTAGTPSADVLSVQGEAGMTPLKVDASATTQPVSGTVNIGTIPEVEVKNDAGNPLVISGAVTVSDGSGPLTVDGTVSVGNFPATQPVSAAALPLPAGAATDATLTGGTQKALLHGAAKGATLAADATTTAAGADHQSLDVIIRDVAGAEVVPLTDTKLRATPVPVTENALSAWGGDAQTIGAAAVQLTAQVAQRGILIALDDDAPGDVYLGAANTVTAANAPIRLRPGQNRTLPLTNANLVFAIATIAGCIIRVSAV